MRRTSRQQEAEILSEEKEKVEKVRRLASCTMDYNMEEMEEITAEVILGTCCKMYDME